MFGHSVTKSLANLVVEVGTRLSHQILLFANSAIQWQAPGSTVAKAPVNFQSIPIILSPIIAASKFCEIVWEDALCYIKTGPCTLLEVHPPPDNKVHGANMGPTWVLSAPDGPHVGHMNLSYQGRFFLVGSFRNDDSKDATTLLTSYSGSASRNWPKFRCRGARHGHGD